MVASITLTGCLAQRHVCSVHVSVPSVTASSHLKICELTLTLLSVLSFFILSHTTTTATTTTTTTTTSTTATNNNNNDKDIFYVLHFSSIISIIYLLDMVECALVFLFFVQ